MKEQIRKLHDGRRDVIKSGKSTRYLSNDKVKIQVYKSVACTMCEETITCQQNLQEHKELKNGLKALFNCNMCPNIKKGNQ